MGQPAWASPSLRQWAPWHRAVGSYGPPSPGTRPPPRAISMVNEGVGGLSCDPIRVHRYLLAVPPEERVPSCAKHNATGQAREWPPEDRTDKRCSFGSLTVRPGGRNAASPEGPQDRRWPSTGPTIWSTIAGRRRHATARR